MREEKEGGKRGKERRMKGKEGRNVRDGWREMEGGKEGGKI